EGQGDRDRGIRQGQGGGCRGVRTGQGSCFGDGSARRAGSRRAVLRPKLRRTRRRSDESAAKSDRITAFCRRRARHLYWHWEVLARSGKESLATPVSGWTSPSASQPIIEQLLRASRQL